MNSDPNKVFKAVAAIGDALQKLSTDEQQKVLDGVIAVLGLKAPKVTATTQAQDGETSTPEQLGNGKRLSLVEFVKEKKPGTNAQAIATFAAYRNQHEGQEFFSREDLQGYFA